LAHLAWDAGKALTSDLSWEQEIALATVEGLWEFGTVGWGQIADLTAGAIAAGIDAAQYFGQFYWDWTQYSEGWSTS
jgi:hypothetical protein